MRDFGLLIHFVTLRRKLLAHFQRIGFSLLFSAFSMVDPETDLLLKRRRLVL